MTVITENMGYTVDTMAGRPPTKEATKFGKRVAVARLQRGLTQRELADRIGVSLRMMEYYERRAENVKSDVVVKLAEVLNVSTDELLGVRYPKAKPGRKSRLQAKIAQLEDLPRSKQQAIIQVLDMALQSG